MLPAPASLITAIGALAAVLGLIWLAQRALRATRLAPRAAGPRRLAVLDVLALDPRRRLHLVRCEGRSVLLLTGGAQDIVVGWTPAEPTVAAPPAEETAP
jgi:flagellar protein FliO/FliZ